MQLQNLLTPIRLFIVVLVIILVCMSKSKNYNSNENWAAAFGYLFVISSIVILFISEVIMNYFFQGMTKGQRVLISIILIFILLTLLQKTFGWLETVKNYYYVPIEYKNEFVVLIYNHKNGKLIKPNYEIPRKRKLKFNENGFLKIKNKAENIFSPWPVIKIGNRKNYPHKLNTTISTVNRYKFENFYCDLILFNYDKNLNIDSIKSLINEKELKEYISMD